MLPFWRANRGVCVQSSDPPPERATHPALFLLLYLPFGAVSGYLVATLERFYMDAGVSLAAFGLLISLALSPHIFKVAWAPLVDTTLGLRRWYGLASAVIAAGIAATGFLTPGPAAMPMLTVLAVGASLAATFSGMACESLMAHTTLPHRRGAAGGWSQAGSVGGAGLGGGAGLWLMSQLHSLALTGCIIGGVCAFCSLAIVFAPSVIRPVRAVSYLKTLQLVVKDCWSVGWTRAGLLTLLIFLLPLGSGGAANLFSGMSKDWHVSIDTLSKFTWVVGVSTGLMALVGGFICDRMDRKTAYCLFGVLEGVLALGMALAPRTPEWFIVFAFAYSASIGLAYAAYAAVTLETIGAGAAATKWNLFASVSNIPVTIMPTVDGWAATRFGPGGMLQFEFWLALGAAALFATVSLATRRRPALALAS